MDQGTLKSYIAGFIASIVLTLAAYFAVVHPEYFHLPTSTAILVAILALAILQLIVQMLFFLHVGSEPGRNWKLTVFFSTLSLVLIIVIGSIWIMNHLNYNMMASPTEMNQYIQDQQGGF
jgi:cytochrome o ubiquinol oxidase operon protein cyoD